MVLIQLNHEKPLQSVLSNHNYYSIFSIKLGKMLSVISKEYQHKRVIMITFDLLAKNQKTMSKREV